MSQTLAHELNPFFPDFARFNSTPELEASSLYQELRPRIDSVLEGYEYGVFAAAAEPKQDYRAIAWNIERGRHFEGILEGLQSHPGLSGADIYLLTEADLGMARSKNLNVARDLAKALGLNYFFAPSYINLSKGCGHESEYEEDNTLGIHGSAILSRYPLSNFRTVPLSNGKDKMKGNEKRLGTQRALVADVHLGDQVVTAACVHLDAHSSQEHRRQQLLTVLKTLKDLPPDHPIIIGGDWNTSTYNSSHAIHAITGFWVRVAMGVDNMIRNHYPYPERYWEKKLFETLETEGFEHKRSNALGVGTLIYDFSDIEQEKNLKEWIPDWCFRFIEWSLRNHNGRLQFKLDWFTTRNVNPFNPRVIDTPIVHGKRASDHCAIVTDFRL